MDVDHEGVTLPRRRMRRPTAGAIPSPLESWLDPEPEWEVPGWVWFAIGGATTSLALAFAGWALVAYWFDKTFGRS